MEIDSCSKLIINGPDFISETEDLIRSAKETIFLHTYIFHYDQTTINIIEELKIANARGVKVFIILDGFGSLNFPNQIFQALKNQGIHLVYFKPLLRFKELGIRLHQKVLIVDKKFAITGGINYSSQFNSLGKMSPWLDHSILIRNPEITNELLKKVSPIYCVNFNSYRYLFSVNKDSQDQKRFFKVLENNWTRYRQEIYRDYLQNINRAQFEIVIFATYFIPGKKLLKYLKKASKRGVKVKLIFGTSSDHPISKLASDYFYKWYLKQGFEIYEWTSSIVHSKLAMFDQEVVTIGSYNHNFISRYANLELNISIKDFNFTEQVKKEVQRILSHSQLIEASTLKDNILNKFLSSSIYVITNLLAFLSVIFIYRNYKAKRTQIKKN